VSGLESAEREDHDECPIGEVINRVSGPFHGSLSRYGVTNKLGTSVLVTKQRLVILPGLTTFWQPSTTFFKRRGVCPVFFRAM